MVHTVPKQYAPSESTPVVIDTARAIELLTQVVEEVGYDHTYDGPFHQPDPVKQPDVSTPRYLDEDGRPVCIVARALAAAGVRPSELAGREGCNAREVLAALAAAGRVLASAEATYVFDAAQEEQDAFESWGRALAYARSVAEDVTSC